MIILLKVTAFCIGFIVFAIKTARPDPIEEEKENEYFKPKEIKLQADLNIFSKS